MWFWLDNKRLLTNGNFSHYLHVQYFSEQSKYIISSKDIINMLILIAAYEITWVWIHQFANFIAKFILKFETIIENKVHLRNSYSISMCILSCRLTPILASTRYLLRCVDVGKTTFRHHIYLGSIHRQPLVQARYLRHHLGLHGL